MNDFTIFKFEYTKISRQNEISGQSNNYELASQSLES